MFLEKIKNSWRNSQWLKWSLVLLGLYTFLPLFFYPQYYFINRPLSWLVRLFVQSYTWIILTPFILWIGFSFPIEYPQRWRNLLILCFSPFFFAALHTIIFVLIWHVGVWGEPPLARGMGFYLNIFTGSTLLCAVIIAFHQALNYSRKYRDREFRLQQAQLQALKMQLNPHFLFNTLNAISEFVYDSPQIANQTITQLSDLLRLSLKENNAHQVTLKEELDFLRKYVQIQQTLLEERLKVNWKIDSDVLDALVPGMILQPLIENSIIHGIAPKESGGLIEICARRRNAALQLYVSDDGEGFPPESELNTGGVGLANIRARLQHLYREKHEFIISSPPEGGTAVSLSIPFIEKTVEKKNEHSNNYSR